MKVTTQPVLTDADQQLLDGVQVRLLAPAERERFDQLRTHASFACPTSAATNGCFSSLQELHRRSIHTTH